MYIVYQRGTFMDIKAVDRIMPVVKNSTKQNKPIKRESVNTFDLLVGFIPEAKSSGRKSGNSEKVGRFINSLI